MERPGGMDNHDEEELRARALAELQARYYGETAGAQRPFAPLGVGAGERIPTTAAGAQNNQADGQSSGDASSPSDAIQALALAPSPFRPRSRREHSYNHEYNPYTYYRGSRHYSRPYSIPMGSNAPQVAAVQPVPAVPIAARVPEGRVGRTDELPEENPPPSVTLGLPMVAIPPTGRNGEIVRSPFYNSRAYFSSFPRTFNSQLPFEEQGYPRRGRGVIGVASPNAQGTFSGNARPMRTPTNGEWAAAARCSVERVLNEVMNLDMNDMSSAFYMEYVVPNLLPINDMRTLRRRYHPVPEAEPVVPTKPEAENLPAETPAAATMTMQFAGLQMAVNERGAEASVATTPSATQTESEMVEMDSSTQTAKIDMHEVAGQVSPSLSHATMGVECDIQDQMGTLSIADQEDAPAAVDNDSE